MTEVQKASFEYCEKANENDELYDAFEHGANWKEKQFNSLEARTERNSRVISDFMEHCKNNDVHISDKLFESYLGA